ncbi:MMPL family transporter [Myxococcota bacterium]|nr:MMPL family transporter [Myxococcota bacterium]
MAQGKSLDIGPIERLNERFAALAGWCFDQRALVAGVCLALLIGLGTYAFSGIETDASYEAYFYEGDNTYLAYEAYREDFGSDEVAYIGFELPGVEHGPWNVKAMGALVSLTEALEDEVPFIYDVTTLANAELTIGNEEGLDISKIAYDWPLTQAELLERRDAYLSKPMFVGGIINERSDFGAIIVKMDRSSTDPPEEIIAEESEWLFPGEPENTENMYPQITDAKIREVLSRPEYAEFVFYNSGDVPLNAYYNRILFIEPVKMFAITLGVVSLILFIAFRTFVSVVTPAAVLILTLVSTVALMVLLGFKINMSFGSTPTLLMAIGVAHSVHVLSEFGVRFRALGDRRAAIVESIYLVGVPCLLTSVTTAVGFASMSFVPIKSIGEGAIYQAFGVLAAFFFSVTLLMALLSMGKRHRAVAQKESTSKGGEMMKRALEGLAEFNIKYRNALIGVFAVFLVVLGTGATRVQVDSNWLDDFWQDSWIYETTTRVDDEMGGTTNIIYLFDGGEKDAIKEPAVLREIDRLQQLANEESWLVRKTYSIVDIIKDLNQSLHADDPAYYRIPDTREEIAQYLILYESSGGEEAEEYVSPDYRRANLELRLRLGPTTATQELVAKLDAALAQEPMESSTLSLTGIGALWLVLMNYIMSSQIQGFTIAFSVITLMMIGIFRSVRIGLISMVPNLAPVFLALGAMGWFGISLDYNKVGIAAIALGISVDDTIHLMARFRHEFRVHGSYQKALRESLGDVGRALIITSAALVLGFLVNSFSEMRSQAYYGILLSGALVTALIADFLFMPSLVLWLKPFGPEGEGRPELARPELGKAA